jgi:hypothetical protein
VAVSLTGSDHDGPCHARGVSEGELASQSLVELALDRLGRS